MVGSTGWLDFSETEPVSVVLLGLELSSRLASGLDGGAAGGRPLGALDAASAPSLMWATLQRDQWTVRRRGAPSAKDPTWISTCVLEGLEVMG